MTGKPMPIRLDEDTLRRLDELAERMSERTGGANITRANALRAVIASGLPVLEQENGLGRNRGTPKPRKAK
jgi:predicted transcriptional regulator